MHRLSFLSRPPFIGLFGLLLFYSCQSDNTNTSTSDKQNDFVPVELFAAQQFSLQRNSAFTQVALLQPSGSAKQPLRYRFGHCRDCIPKPVQRIVCNSTTTAIMLRALGTEAQLVGMTQGQFLYDSVLYTAWENGDIADIGQAGGAISYEKLIALQPQLFLYHGSQQDAAYRRLKELGIPVLFMAEQLEQHPLGRAEWLRLVGELVGKADLARQQFLSVATAYEALQKKQQDWQEQPRVLLGLPYQGSWFMPGKESFVAQYIRDAGGKYLFEHLDATANTAIDWEVVYALRDSVDFWIDVPRHKSLAALREADKRYADFKAFQQERVYSNAKRRSEQGGYDIFESAVLNPHLVLRDFVEILHPEAFRETALFYYEKLPPN